MGALVGLCQRRVQRLIAPLSARAHSALNACLPSSPEPIPAPSPPPPPSLPSSSPPARPHDISSSFSSSGGMIKAGGGGPPGGGAAGGMASLVRPAGSLGSCSLGSASLLGGPEAADRSGDSVRDLIDLSREEWVDIGMPGEGGALSCSGGGGGGGGVGGQLQQQQLLQHAPGGGADPLGASGGLPRWEAAGRHSLEVPGAASGSLSAAVLSSVPQHWPAAAGRPEGASVDAGGGGQGAAGAKTALLLRPDESAVLSVCVRHGVTALLTQWQVAGQQARDALLGASEAAGGGAVGAAGAAASSVGAGAEPVLLLLAEVQRLVLGLGAALTGQQGGLDGGGGGGAAAHVALWGSDGCVPSRTPYPLPCALHPSLPSSPPSPICHPALCPAPPALTPALRPAPPALTPALRPAPPALCPTPPTPSP